MNSEVCGGISIKGIVSYEPGSGFPFPKGEAPAPIKTSSFFGDFIPKEPSANPHQDYWRAAVKMARLWAEAVNRHGGDALVVELPEKGLTGNTHFLFAEKNNLQVADLLSGWLKDKGLDQK